MDRINTTKAQMCLEETSFWSLLSRRLIIDVVWLCVHTLACSSRSVEPNDISEALCKFHLMLCIGILAATTPMWIDELFCSSSINSKFCTLSQAIAYDWWWWFAKKCWLFWCFVASLRAPCGTTNIILQYYSLSLWWWTSRKVKSLVVNGKSIAQKSRHELVLIGLYANDEGMNVFNSCRKCPDSTANCYWFGIFEEFNWPQTLKK